MIKQALRRVAAEGSNRTKKLLSALRPHEPLEQGGAHLDAQYASGQWEYLGSLGEAPRFGVVSAYCRMLASGGSLAELGCGEGLLVEQLDRSRFTDFTGVDVSSVAIDRARRLEDDRTTFFAADAETFTPHRSYDLIIFNEVLEYFEDPLGLVRRYEPYVKPGGHFIVSLFDEPFTIRTRRIWKLLHGRYETVTRSRVQTQWDYKWDIEAFSATPRPVVGQT